MTIQEWINNTTTVLTSSGIMTARLDALVLLEDAIGSDRAYLLAQPEAMLDQTIVDQLDEKIMRRCSHEPIAYIRGKSEFYGREFAVNEFVLVPRPESENIINLLKTLAGNAARIIDIGTGSGALAITAKLEMPEAMVAGIDIDEHCLKVASENAAHLHANVDFTRGDLLQPILNEDLSHGVILANLPYVPDSYEINRAATHEPTMAIFGGNDGLELYRRMFSEAKSMTYKPVFIFTESMPEQHANLSEIASLSGYTLMDTEGFIQAYRL